MTLFATKAPTVVKNLMSDFGLTLNQACGIVGNLGHESDGFAKMQEEKPIAGRGGYGWAQWTGPRRVAFERWANVNKFSPSSDAANYGYLKHELETTQAASLRAVKECPNLRSATRAFEMNFEHAGIPNMASRYQWAQRALAAYNMAEELKS